MEIDYVIKYISFQVGFLPLSLRNLTRGNMHAKHVKKEIIQKSDFMKKFHF